MLFLYLLAAIFDLVVGFSVFHVDVTIAGFFIFGGLCFLGCAAREYLSTRRS